MIDQTERTDSRFVAVAAVEEEGLGAGLVALIVLMTLFVAFWAVVTLSSISAALINPLQQSHLHQKQ